jgi:hypothetical protein
VTDPLTGHSLGKPSFVTHEEYRPPTSEPRDPIRPLVPQGARSVEPKSFTPVPAPGREPIGLLARTEPSPPPVPREAQQPDPNVSDLQRQVRELQARNARKEEQIALLQQRVQERTPSARELVRRR